MNLRSNSLSSARLFERAQRTMPGGNTRYTTFTPPHPVYLQRGEGAYVIDADGRRYLDLQNNFTTLVHGHCFEPVTEALTRQLDLGTCFSNPTESEIGLAELLCERVPFFDSVRFMNTGTEAVMTAIKAARAFTGRAKVAKAEGGYHGAYDYVEVSLDASPENWGSQTPRPVPFCEGTPDFVLSNTVVFPYNRQAAAEQALTPHLDDLACVIIDPVPARVAAEPLEACFLRWLRDFTSRHGILLISDEVLSFRVSSAGAMALLGVTPDLCTFGKIIGGGLPIGALGGAEDIMALFDPRHGKPAVPQAGTFTANPLSMVAGLAAMEPLDAARFRQLDQLGEEARSGMRELSAKAELPIQVTGFASLLRLHFTETPPIDYRSCYHGPVQRKRRDAFIRALWDADLLIAPTGLGVLSTAMTRGDIDYLLDRFAGVLRRMGELDAQFA